MLLQRRDAAVNAGIKAGASLDSIAGRVEKATRRGIAEVRAVGRAAGVARLRSEASVLGRSIIAGPGWLPPEIARDVTRSGLYSESYAKQWLKKANEAAERTDAVAKAAKIANVESVGSLKRTAVTESSEAFSSGRAKYLRSSSALGLLRVWDAQLDSCPICQGADGTIVGAREPFPLGEPGSVHAWCRCSWTLLSTTQSDDQTLIQPVELPAQVSVPAKVMPAKAVERLPSVSPLPGGKIAVDAETKAWAKRLDVALGNVSKDGGKAARVELRAMLDRFGYKGARKLEAGHDLIKIADSGDMAGMSAYADWDGSVVLSDRTLKRSRGALRKMQLGADPGDDAHELSALLHEELHGASALKSTAYRGHGAALEEATTELAARRITAKLTGRELSAIYNDEISGLQAVVSRYSKAKPEALAKKIDDAILSIKSKAPLAATPEEHAQHFVKALKLTPKQSAQTLKDLTETPWWKPEHQGKASPLKAIEAPKPKPVKVAKKATGPPKAKQIRDPQVQELLNSGFSGAVDTRGLRQESFAHLRAGGAVHGGSPILKIRADGTVDIVDGRHRITLARERGDKSIVARIMTEGPRGGTKEYGERVVPLLPAGPGKQTVAATSKSSAAAKTEKARIAAEAKLAKARATAEAKAKVAEKKALAAADKLSNAEIKATLKRYGVKVTGKVSEELRLFFGTDKTPSAADIKAMLGLDSIGATSKFKGELKVGRFNLEYRGTTANSSVSISRSYRKDLRTGEISAKHDSLYLSQHAQGRKLGSSIVREQVEAYERLGIKSVTLNSAEVGRYYWPKIGFEGSADALASAKAQLGAWLERNGVRNARTIAGAPRSMREIATLQVGERRVGKEFLLSKDYGGDLLRLKVDRADPAYQIFRREIGLAPKPARIAAPTPAPKPVATKPAAKASPKPAKPAPKPAPKPTPAKPKPAAAPKPVAAPKPAPKPAVAARPVAATPSNKPFVHFSDAKDFEVTKDAQAAAAKVLGKPVGANEIRDLVGLERHLGEFTVTDAKYTVRAYDNGKVLKVKYEALINGHEVDIGRTFYREGNDLVVHNDCFWFGEGFQGKGIGKKAIADQVRQYVKLGVKRADLDPHEVGKYMWPRMGYRPKGGEAVLQRVRSEFRAYLKQRGMRPENIEIVAERAKTLHDIAVFEYKGRHVGKDFLLKGGASIGDLEFDFTPGSLDMKNAAEYLGL